MSRCNGMEAQKALRSRRQTRRGDALPLQSTVNSSTQGRSIVPSLLHFDINNKKTAIMVDRAHKPSALSPSTTGPQPTVHSDGKKVTASLPSGDSVEVMLYGATVISWKNNGQENMWLSSNANMEGKKAIRGGVPVVFPVRPYHSCLPRIANTDHFLNRTSALPPRTTLPQLSLNTVSLAFPTGSTLAPLRQSLVTRRVATIPSASTLA